jgi:hypothetical protein
LVGANKVTSILLQSWRDLRIFLDSVVKLVAICKESFSFFVSNIISARLGCKVGSPIPGIHIESIFNILASLIIRVNTSNSIYHGRSL